MTIIGHKTKPIIRILGQKPNTKRHWKDSVDLYQNAYSFLCESENFLSVRNRQQTLHWRNTKACNFKKNPICLHWFFKVNLNGKCLWHLSKLGRHKEELNQKRIFTLKNLSHFFH